MAGTLTGNAARPTGRLARRVAKQHRHRDPKHPSGFDQHPERGQFQPTLQLIQVVSGNTRQPATTACCLRCCKRARRKPSPSWRVTRVSSARSGIRPHEAIDRLARALTAGYQAARDELATKGRALPGPNRYSRCSRRRTHYCRSQRKEHTGRAATSRSRNCDTRSSRPRIGAALDLVNSRRSVGARSGSGYAVLPWRSGVMPGILGISFTRERSPGFGCQCHSVDVRPKYRCSVLNDVPGTEFNASLSKVPTRDITGHAATWRDRPTQFILGIA